MSTWTRVGNDSDIAPGGWRVVDVDGVAMLVVNVEGSFHCIEDVCTHDGGGLAGGTLCGFEVECPRHGARFDVRTGQALCAPAYQPTAVFPIKIEDGQIWVRDDRWD